MGLLDLIGHKYPFTDFHELNLDWCITAVLHLQKAFEDFSAGNKLIFANPLQHDLTKTYAKNTIVIDTVSGTAYLSLDTVPKGVQLDNASYWLPVFDFAGYVTRANRNFTDNYFSGTDRTPIPLIVGDWVVLDDVLYKVTTAMAADDLFIIGTNIVHFTVEQFLKDFTSSIIQIVNQYKADIDASELAYRQQLAQDITDITANLQAQLDAAIAGVTVDSEVINARIGFDGRTFTTLGEAIRSQIGELAKLGLYYPNYMDLEPIFEGWEQGTFDASGNPTPSTYFYRTVGYCPVDPDRIIRGWINGVGSLTAQVINFYDKDHVFISQTAGTTLLQNMVIPATACYAKFATSAANYTSYITTNLTKIAFVTNGSDTWDLTNAAKLTPLTYGAAGLTASSKCYIGISNTGMVRSTVNADGTITLYIQYHLRLFNNNDINTDLDWTTISTNITSYITISGNSATITLPAYRQLVLNMDDLNLYIKKSTETLPSDFVILSNTNYFPQGWAVNVENYQRRLTSDDVIDRTTVARYNIYSANSAAACEKLEASILDLAEFEQFIFVTDPHTLMNFPDNKPRADMFLNCVETYFKQSSADFVLYGGDWLTSGDTEDEAAYKLGLVKGVSRNTKSYLLVGNHDTNYQGGTKLSLQSIFNLWYNGNPSFFSFEGNKTRFYCFDTGVEAQALADDNDYGYIQANWFADSLLTETYDHIAILAHMLYYQLSPTAELQPLAEQLLLIAEAYNNRTTVIVGSTPYDFSAATGKVEFYLAGHTHTDADYVLHDITCITTRNAYTYGQQTPSFDLISVDYDNSQINMFRVGLGSDRVIAIN